MFFDPTQRLQDYIGPRRICGDVDYEDLALQLKRLTDFERFEDVDLPHEAFKQFRFGIDKDAKEVIARDRKTGEVVGHLQRNNPYVPNHWRRNRLGGAMHAVRHIAQPEPDMKAVWSLAGESLTKGGLAARVAAHANMIDIALQKEPLSVPKKVTDDYEFDGNDHVRLRRPWGVEQQERYHLELPPYPDEDCLDDTPKPN